MTLPQDIIAQVKKRRKNLNRNALRHVVHGGRIPARHQTCHRICRSLRRSTPPPVLNLRRAFHFRIWRLPIQHCERHAAKAPAVQVRSISNRDGTQLTTKNAARRLLFVTAVTIHLPNRQRSTRHLLAIKMHIELPLSHGYPYNRGGCLKRNGTKWKVADRPPADRPEERDGQKLGAIFKRQQALPAWLSRSVL